ncbi:MAG TPA: flavin reductase family protein [Candidatus Fermentibacter daniensis]|nr:flavin reductase [Candidatus Fermentibacter sp.]OQC69502.1 MAG: High molecular weight rubredoxin [candidate division Hyd24-12 bacterium ADurb.Bin004]HOA04778.1 flavin reductase family protein [Candidatus Fermentibacter daniensis]MCC6871629.1 flavin reductase [Candidatus Fermentibacter sp.]HOD18646.1 flavin reductase family protein [Candidatus Fermentibacter daniensis]
MDKTALHTLSYGVCIVSAGAVGRRNGQICNTVFQVTSEPATVAISINKLNLTHEILGMATHFSVSVLGEETPMTFIGRFGFRTGRDFDKMEGVGVRTGVSGCPVVTDNAVAFLECRLMSSFDCGTHTVFLGELEDAGILSGGAPMTYAYYHQVKKGKSPDRAPTFIGK